MRNTHYPLTRFILLALFMASSHALAGKIPLGINSSHGIFLQEIWQRNTPFLCVANRSGFDQIIQVSSWRSSLVPADPLLQWKAHAESVQCHDASVLTVEGLLEFKLVDGKRLGLLRAPANPPVESKNPAALSSFQGINGSCPTPGTWIEQPGLWLKSGQPTSLTLLTSVSEPDALIEFPVNTKLNLPHLQLKSVTSSSLLVEKENGGFLIKAGPQTDIPSLHRVQLDFDVPKVTQPTMYLLSGRKRILQSGWQCFIRGILVAP